MVALGLVPGLLGCAEPSNPLAGANVLLIVVDALAAGHLGSHGYTRTTSPFIDSLARRSVLFENAISTASHTVPSTVSLFASAYPSRHQNHYYSLTRSFRRAEAGVRPSVPKSLPWMAELLRDGGYSTVAVTANPWLRERYGFTRGFDSFHFLPGEQHQLRAPALLAKAVELFGKPRDRPFFLYLHYMDVHNPYRPPEPYRTDFTTGLRGRNLRGNGPVPRASAEDIEMTRALYDAEIRGFDAALKRLWAALEKAGLADSTLLIFTSDHGEEFLEHGAMGHGWTLFEESLHVPLFFHHPALVEHATRVSEPVSNVDLLPSLLELLGLPVPDSLDGTSLAPRILGARQPELERRVLFSELGQVKAARRGAHKLISSNRRDELHAPGSSAFELRSDPLEQTALREPAWQQELEEELLQLHATTRASSEASRRAETEVPEEPREEWFEEQLRALGYVE